MVQACSAVREIYRQAGLTNTEEQLALPAQSSPFETSTSSTISQTITLPSGAVVSFGRNVSQAGNMVTSTATHGTVVTAVKSVVSQSGYMASSAIGMVSYPGSVSRLAGQRYEAARIKAGIVGPGASADVKQEPQVLYSCRPEEQGRSVRIVQVKQESVEYTCAGKLLKVLGSPNLFLNIMTDRSVQSILDTDQ